MKKTLILAMLALSLVACDQKNTDELKATEAQKQEEISENTQEDSEVVDDKDIENEEDEEENEINRTYPEDKSEKEVISVEKSKEKDEKDKKEDSENSEKNKKDKKKKEKKKKSDKKSDKKSGKDSKKDENTDEKALTEDDLFFSYFNLVTVRGGEVCDGLTDIRDYGKDYFASYVPFSNNVFVLGSYPDKDFSIRKINGDDLTLLYEFKENESFRPVGMVGDRIYGFYSFYEGEDNNSKLDNTKSGFGYVDLKNGKVGVYEASKIKEGGSLINVAITDKEAYLTKFAMGTGTNLYKLDLTKDLDQEAELVEENTELSLLGTGKHFKDGKANYEVFKTKDDKLKIGEIEYQLTDEKVISFIGENVIIQTPVKFDDSKYLFKIDIVNYLTGETIEKDLETYGFRVSNGKFYYIDYDKKVQSLDIGLWEFPPSKKLGGFFIRINKKFSKFSIIRYNIRVE